MIFEQTKLDRQFVWAFSSHLFVAGTTLTRSTTDKLRRGFLTYQKHELYTDFPSSSKEIFELKSHDEYLYNNNRLLTVKRLSHQHLPIMPLSAFRKRNHRVHGLVQNYIDNYSALSSFLCRFNAEYCLRLS